MNFQKNSENRSLSFQYNENFVNRQIFKEQKSKIFVFFRRFPSIFVPGGRVPPARTQPLPSLRSVHGLRHKRMC